MNEPEFITVTKLDAARRQLRTAIELWFADADAVSIHTLACAAHDVIHDLNRRKKGPSLLYDSEALRPERKKEIVARMKEAASFFKHADFRKNRSATITFNPEISQWFVFYALWGLMYLGEPYTDTELAFRAWLLIHEPDILTPEAQKMIVDLFGVEQINNLRKIPKHEFLKRCLAIAHKIKR